MIGSHIQSLGLSTICNGGFYRITFADIKGTCIAGLIVDHIKRTATAKIAVLSHKRRAVEAEAVFAVRFHNPFCFFHLIAACGILIFCCEAGVNAVTAIGASHKITIMVHNWRLHLSGGYGLCNIKLFQRVGVKHTEKAAVHAGTVVQIVDLTGHKNHTVAESDINKKLVYRLPINPGSFHFFPRGQIQFSQILRAVIIDKISHYNGSPWYIIPGVSGILLPSQHQICAADRAVAVGYSLRPRISQKLRPVGRKSWYKQHRQRQYEQQNTANDFFHSTRPSFL